MTGLLMNGEPRPCKSVSDKMVRHCEDAPRKRWQADRMQLGADAAIFKFPSDVMRRKTRRGVGGEAEDHHAPPVELWREFGILFRRRS